jgi:replicative DNA helicase
MESNNTRGKKATGGRILKPTIGAEHLGKIPPHSEELEQVVLGALMIEKDSLIEVVEFLQPEVFFDDRNQRIYLAIKQLFQDSQPVDILTVTERLRFNGDLDAAGGAFYITQLTARVNSAANIVYHSRLLLQYAIKRMLITLAGEVQAEAFDDTTDVFEVLDKMQQSLFEISEKNIRKNYARVDSVFEELVKELEEARNREDGLTGVPSGFSELDKITSGWQKSALIIVAARPGMGKTAFMLSIARNAAVDFKRPVAIFSLEMSLIELQKRLCSLEAEIDNNKLKNGKISEAEWGQFIHKTQRLVQAPIFMDDTPALSVLELRAKSRKLKKQHDIQMIIVDYLQLMSGGENAKNGNREQEIAYISRSLKGLAKELNIPVIALAQLSRQAEAQQGSTKIPQLSHLRESGSIEQDADMVIFLYRPEYYNLTEDEDGQPTKNVGRVIIAKHRSGSLGDIKLKFLGQFTKFCEFDGYDLGDNVPFMDNFATPANTVTLQSSMNKHKTSPDFESNLPNKPTTSVPFNEEPPF